MSEGYEVPLSYRGDRLDQLLYASLSHIHYWYEVGMLKYYSFGTMIVDGRFLIGPINRINKTENIYVVFTNNFDIIPYDM